MEECISIQRANQLVHILGRNEYQLFASWEGGTCIKRQFWPPYEAKK